MHLLHILWQDIIAVLQQGAGTGGDQEHQGAARAGAQQQVLVFTGRDAPAGQHSAVSPRRRRDAARILERDKLVD